MAAFWTARIVCEHLIQAFRSFPSHAVYAASGTIKTFNAHPSTADAFSWAPRFLADYPKARLHLFTYARCRAQRESWSEFCRLKDWPRATAEASRRLAAEVIAEALNREAAERQGAAGPCLGSQNSV